MQPTTERRIQQRLAADPVWAAHPVGQLARRMLDNGVPVTPVAQYLGVAGVVLRRWLYGYGGQTYYPGGRLAARAEMLEKIDVLCRIIDLAWRLDRLQEPWLDNFKQTETSLQPNVL